MIMELPSSSARIPGAPTTPQGDVEYFTTRYRTVPHKIYHAEYAMELRLSPARTCGTHTTARWAHMHVVQYAVQRNVSCCLCHNDNQVPIILSKTCDAPTNSSRRRAYLSILA